VASRVHGPYDGIEGGIEEGRFLYVRMNCAYCHGFDGTGGMGPDLTDASWRYGGTDADVFASIYLGRAAGMPAWGPALTQDQIWKLVAYVRSLGGAAPRRVGQPGTRDETRKTSANTVEGR
jgi:cytochrome c oxidase cbb3-type subunit 3